jgi:NAD(P)-dependent dehydrogenase (short-subunit alcohol dehydrogenase family)
MPGIGAGIASQLAASGWDIAFTYWTAYETRMTWGVEAGAADAIQGILAGHGAGAVAIEADLTDTGAPARIFDETEKRMGGVTALVICHCESVASGAIGVAALGTVFFARVGHPSVRSYFAAAELVFGIAAGLYFLTLLLVGLLPRHAATATP